MLHQLRNHAFQVAVALLGALGLILTWQDGRDVGYRQGIQDSTMREIGRNKNLFTQAAEVCAQSAYETEQQFNTGVIAP